MSRERARRAGRIIELRALVVDRLEVELGILTRRTGDIAASLRLARHHWQTAVSEPAVSWCSSGDMVHAHDYHLGLTRRIDVLTAEERTARLAEEDCRSRLCAAKLDSKKIELWRDGLLDAARAEELGQERKTTDEIAARIARTG